ncbi:MULTISPECIES: DUF4947 domain-containing protein [Enterococcus]|uniref:DUF4947 domain-containing protein n=1 Tax=Enterococcus TaxID=1350 RepID=UPI0010F81AD1|nr:MULTISPECIES: DUF4947 domain-containing protein [Enterococcus]KAF1301133.1 hypothetical protein BAU16_10355 [Enterococcus sp. JM9B]
MKALVCEFCGGNRFKKVRNGYECEYCHAVYPSNEIDVPVDISHRKSHFGIWLAAGIIFFVGIGFALHGPLEKGIDGLGQGAAVTTKATKWSEDELKNPQRNVMIAELTLNQEEISKAKVSIAKYGGDKTKEYGQRLDLAQKEHDKLEKNRLTRAPKKDMLIENPDSDLAATSYYKENGFLLAYIPEYTQYSEKDVTKAFGKPDEILTDPNKIRENIVLNYDDENLENSEMQILQKELRDGQLTWREVRAFLLALNDFSAVSFTKEFVYEEQGKPNVYFEGEKIIYISPIPRYVYFTRIPESHPYNGLGSYPEDFPENYTEKGTCQ